MTDDSDREHAHDDTGTPLFDHARFVQSALRALIARRAKRMHAHARACFRLRDGFKRMQQNFTPRG